MSRIAIISPIASKEIKKKLANLDFEPLGIPRCNLVDDPISYHPDIQIFIHKNKIFCHPNIPGNFLNKLKKNNDIIICKTKLNNKYPGDIPYNIACTGKFAFHKTEITDNFIAEYLFSQNIKLINIRQGYSKCSTLVIDNERIITADSSIHRAAELNNIKSLLIARGFIDLPGYKYGFIGGATGTFGNKIFFSGKIDHHPDYRRIMNWIYTSNKMVIYLSNERAIDLGTIFFLD